MEDPVAGLGEMARVTRKDGVVAASVWDYAGGRGPLSPFWDAVRELDPDVAGRVAPRGRSRGTPRRSCWKRQACARSRSASLEVSVEHASFEDWWEPFTLGVGPAGGYVAGLDPEQRAELEERCHEKFPAAPFVLTSRAWAARGLA